MTQKQINGREGGLTELDGLVALGAEDDVVRAARARDTGHVAVETDRKKKPWKTKGK